MTVRKPLEQPAELKGVFGEGKSVVAVAPSAPPANDDTAHGLFKAPGPANDAPSALVSRPERDRTSARPVTDEAQRRLYELRAQSRGLWTDSSDKIPAVVTQPKIERLPRAVLGLSTPAPLEPSSRPVASLDSDAPTSPPPESAAPAVPAAWSSDHSNRPTDVRRSLRPISMRPSEEPPPELDRRSTPLVARPDEPLLSDDESTVVAPEMIAAAAAAAEAEELPAALAQAVQQGAAEAEHRAGKRRALLVLVACVVLIGLGLLLGLWPTPWSSSKPAQEPASSRAPASSAAEPAAPPAPSAAMPPSAAPVAAAPEVRPADAPPSAPPPADTPPQPAAAQPSAAEPPPAAAAEAPQAPSPQPIAAAPSNLSDALRIARAELRARNPAGAEAVLRPLLDANPEDHHIGELLVQALIDERKGNEAAALAQRIIKKRPKRAVYRVLLGDAYRANGAMNAARAAWREALELEPDNKEALRRLNAP